MLQGGIHTPLNDSLAIDQLPLVELIRRELSDVWVHSILDRQHVVRDSALQKPLKQGSTVPSLRAVLTEHSGWQLLLIPNKDDLRWLMHEWNQT